MVDRNLMAGCGLYCGVCGVLIAHRDNNVKFKERLATVYGCRLEDLACDGCNSGNTPAFCSNCDYRNCVREKGLDGCHQCPDWPCEMVENFPLAVGKKVIMRAVPAWKALGDEAFAAAEEARYQCPECGYPAFRGAKRCRQCKAELDLD